MTPAKEGVLLARKLQDKAKSRKKCSACHCIWLCCSAARGCHRHQSLRGCRGRSKFLDISQNFATCPSFSCFDSEEASYNFLLRVNGLISGVGKWDQALAATAEAAALSERIGDKTTDAFFWKLLQMPSSHLDLFTFMLGFLAVV